MIYPPNVIQPPTTLSYFTIPFCQFRCSNCFRVFYGLFSISDTRLALRDVRHTCVQFTMTFGVWGLKMFIFNANVSLFSHGNSWYARALSNFLFLWPSKRLRMCKAKETRETLLIKASTECCWRQARRSYANFVLLRYARGKLFS